MRDKSVSRCEVTDTAQKKLEDEKEKFEKRTDSDLESFETHENEIAEKFKVRAGGREVHSVISSSGMY